MPLNSLQELYVQGLRDLYSAETQIVKALPKLQKAATNAELKDAFTAHLEQSKAHVARLEQICEALGISPKGKHCKGMEGLLAEGAELLEEQAHPDVMDAGLISSAQHVEHYEIAGYGTLRTYAQLLGHDEQATVLAETLKEEEQTDQLLTGLGLTINIAAIAADVQTSSTK